MSSTAQPIRCKGAVFRLPNQPLTIEEVIVDTPKADEVRVKLYASGVCRSDASSIWGKRGDCVIPYGKPMINGHEGAGVVESIGSQVTEVSVGDHVVLLWMPQCGHCSKCLNPKTNTCLVTLNRGDTEQAWVPIDGKSRFHLVADNSPVLTPSTNCNLATYVEYAIAKQSMVVPIDKSLPLDVMSLFGCSIPTGFGAAANIAKVNPKSSCAIWGLGAVGMAVVLGCKQMGAQTIIGIDMNPEKYEMAKQFGCNHFINPSETDIPTENLIKQLLEEGVDYAFDCIGNQLVIESALKSLSPSGTFVAVGLLQPQHIISLPLMKLLDGLTLTGGLFGNYKGKDGVKELTQVYKNDKYFRDCVNLFVSRRITLNQINEAFDALKNGENVIRSDLSDGVKEVKVFIPDKLTPKKEAFFWQRQIILLFVPTAGLGLGAGGLPVGGLPVGGGLPIGGLPGGVGGGGFNARNRNLERLRALRRRTRIRVRSTTPSYETNDSEK